MVGEHLNEATITRLGSILECGNTSSHLDCRAAVGIFAYPVEAGIVPNLARPGGNITGVAVNIGDEQWDKRVQLLRQVGT